MANFHNSEFMHRGLIVRQGLDTDSLIVAGTPITANGPTGPTGPTGAASTVTGPTGATGSFTVGTASATSNAATLNKPAGIISATISSATTYTLTLTNSVIDSNSVVIWNAYDSNGNAWVVTAITPSTGACAVSFANLSSASSGTLHMNFAVFG